MQYQITGFLLFKSMYQMHLLNKQVNLCFNISLCPDDLAVWINQQQAIFITPTRLFGPNRILILAKQMKVAPSFLFVPPVQKPFPSHVLEETEDHKYVFPFLLLLDLYRYQNFTLFSPKVICTCESYFSFGSISFTSAQCQVVRLGLIRCVQLSLVFKFIDYILCAFSIKSLIGNKEFL